MSVLKRFTWPQLIMLGVLLLGGTLSVLNYTLGWDQPWISFAGPFIVLVAVAFNFRMIWRNSDPRKSSGDGASADEP